MRNWIDALISAFEPPAVTIAREAMRSNQRAAIDATRIARAQAQMVATQRRAIMRHRAAVARAKGIVVSVPKIKKEKTQ